MQRRFFLQSIASLAFAPDSPRVEYLGTATSIEVFQSTGQRRTKIQSVHSQNPTYFTLGVTGKFLFAVNEIADYQGLATGSVESYSVQPLSGRLNLISRQSLSLSATRPRHLAISPDAQHMVVAAYAGGAYNVLPINPNGGLGPVTQIIKELGSSVHPVKQRTAHPHSLAFHPSGRFLISTDLGTDTINVFRFAGGRLTRLNRERTLDGSGPASLTINETGTLVSVTHQLTPFVASYRFNPHTGDMQRLTTVKLSC